MSSHNHPFEAYGAPVEKADPGNAGAINIDRDPMVINLVSGDSNQTRTLARPTRQGARCYLSFKTDGGGDIVVTVTGGFNENGLTTFTFNDAGQFAEFVSFFDGTNYYWRLTTHYAIGNAPNQETLITPAGAGFTGGTGTVYKTSIERNGDIIKTSIFVDLTGLGTSTTDLDIIGVGAAVAHIGRITTAQNGVIDSIRMTCLELPATGADDIDLYAATEGTGVFDGGIAALTETALITAGGAWTNGAVKGNTGDIADGQYMYLCNGEAGTVGTFTAGKFLIELFGHAA